MRTPNRRGSFHLRQSVSFEQGSSVPKPAVGSGIRIKGLVEVLVERGEVEQERQHVQNHFVDGGLRGLVSALVGWRFGASGNSAGSSTYGAWANSFPIRAGFDLVTPTVHDTDALADPTGINPVNQFGGQVTTPTSGLCVLGLSATWDVGAVQGTVGEFGLSMQAFTNITPHWQTSSESGSLSAQFIARVCSADGDFTPLELGEDDQLSINWVIQGVFA